MATPDAYFFGVEIELIAAPIRPRNPFSPEYYYEKLASWIRSFNVRAAADTLVEKYRKYPEHYNKWWITEDGSLKHPEYPCIPLEAVSPVLSTCHRWEGTIEVFWAACDRVFQMPEASHRCGSHIHVSPSPLKMFSLSQLKRVAYGVVFYEPLVEEILPRSRRNHPYCKLNTEHSDELKTIIWSSQDTESSLRRVRHRIIDGSHEETCDEEDEEDSSSDDDSSISSKSDSKYSDSDTYDFEDTDSDELDSVYTDSDYFY
ncbi:SWIM zinc finger domain protein [Colletotrichum tofieldiae]|uniref:SWIM zinc finger domain protein n=1 Tax=Colletotrichum tofieldiae TaxID=708197 RepID=A0A166ZE03_9PEZI|nr:SWIM zinc finger domain protein [Colletotrichum tofieldiae]